MTFTGVFTLRVGDGCMFRKPYCFLASSNSSLSWRFLFRFVDFASRVSVSISCCYSSIFCLARFLFELITRAVSSIVYWVAMSCALSCSCMSFSWFFSTAFSSLSEVISVIEF